MTPEERLDRLVREVVRWNDQISLVSRVDTRPLVDGLVDQCRRGWTLLADASPPRIALDRCAYVDLGSGGGFPGLVWAAERGEAAANGNTLVEPRAKRAWFLRRCVLAMDLPHTSVLEARWGGGSPAVPLGGGQAAEAVLVSMKALRMSDDDVLAGLSAWPALDPGALCGIARFLPPGHADVGALVAEYGRGVDASPEPWVRVDAGVLRGDGLGLYLVTYARG